ncbi:MAG: hypothetical protein ACXQTZ_04875 [Candidatus Alkanophagales archaeon]
MGRGGGVSPACPFAAGRRSAFADGGEVGAGAGMRKWGRNVLHVKT